MVIAMQPLTREVDRPVMIGVAGTHSTGKTSFLARLTHELRRAEVTVATVGDLGEKAMQMGMPILFNHTWASTLWFITRGISDEIAAWLHVDVVLVDRPVPDALGYYLAALDYRNQQPDPHELAYLDVLVRGHSTRYDLIFRTTLDTTRPLGTNRIRDPDDRFRVLADHHVGNVLTDLDIPHDPLPADGHDQALQRAISFTMTRLATHPAR